MQKKSSNHAKIILVLSLKNEIKKIRLVVLPLALPSIECKIGLLNPKTFLSADSCILYAAFMNNVT